MRPVTKIILTVVAAGVLAGLPSAAWAKGPSRATVTGPGLAAPITVGGDGEPGSGGRLAALAEGSGFFAAMFGETPDPMRATPPTTDLGPRYTVTYLVPGGSRDATIIQQLYPLAATGPASYLAPGQTFFDTEKTRGGWYSASRAFLATLRDLGIPATPLPVSRPSATSSPPPAASQPAAASPGPGPRSGPRLSVALPLALGALVLLTVAVIRVRSRRASRTAPGRPGAQGA
jgi:hypothetical protein